MSTQAEFLRLWWMVADCFMHARVLHGLRNGRQTMLLFSEWSDRRPQPIENGASVPIVLAPGLQMSTCLVFILIFEHTFLCDTKQSNRDLTTKLLFIGMHVLKFLLTSNFQFRKVPDQICLLCTSSIPTENYARFYNLLKGDHICFVQIVCIHALEFRRTSSIIFVY